MDRKMIARELLGMAKELVAIDFDTQDAMDKYMKDHPDADRSNHKVVKTEKEEPKKEEPKKEEPKKEEPKKEEPKKEELKEKVKEELKKEESPAKAKEPHKVGDYIENARNFAFDLFHDEDEGNYSDANELMESLEGEKTVEGVMSAMKVWGVKKKEAESYLDDYVKDDSWTDEEWTAKRKELMEAYSGKKSGPKGKKSAARELLGMAKELMAIDFDTQDALDKYLKDHPDADRSNHHVVQQKQDKVPAKKSAPEGSRVEKAQKSILEKYKGEDKETFEHMGIDSKSSLVDTIYDELGDEMSDPEDLSKEEKKEMKQRAKDIANKLWR